MTKADYKLVDYWIPRRGPCAVCEGKPKDARHKILDDIRQAYREGMKPAQIAVESKYPLDVVLAVIRISSYRYTLLTMHPPRREGGGWKSGRPRKGRSP